MAGIGAFLYSALMLSLLRTLEFLGLSLWLGSDVFLSFVVAPWAFRVMAIDPSSPFLENRRYISGGVQHGDNLN